MAHHRNRSVVIKSERPSAGRWLNVLSRGQHIQDAVQRDFQLGSDYARSNEAGR
jgi:hypothetical protein